MTERVLLRVAKGSLVPADGHTQRLLRERRYAIGDELIAELRKPRNPGYHRLMHSFGQLCVENLDAFSRMTAHEALKRLQLEGDIACDHMVIQLGGEEVEYRIPQSLSYASMDQGRVEEVFRAMCNWLAEHYWNALTADQIAALAETMVEAA